MAEDLKKKIESETETEITEIYFGEDLDEIIDESNYSLPQLFTIIISGFIFFLIFVVFLFPVEELLKNFIINTSEKNNTVIDMKKINLPYFGSKSIDNLYISTADNLEFKSEEINFTFNIFNFINKSQIISSIESLSNSLDSNYLALTAKNIQLDINLTNIGRENLLLNGKIQVLINGGVITRVPEIMSNLGFNEIKVKSVQVELKKNNNVVQFEKFFLDLNIAKVLIRGKIELNQNFQNSKLDIEFCPKLSKEFEAERPDLSDLMTLYSQGKSEVCFPVKGTIAFPKVDINFQTN
jgi:type II secretion system protein N